jgi:flagellar hook-associated protein 2
MTVPGNYEVEVDFDAGTVTAARIRVAGETAWTNMDVSGNLLSGPEDSDMQGLQLTAVWEGGTGTQTTNVRVQRGFAGMMHESLDDMLNYSDGVLSIKKNQYDSAMERIDEKIDEQVDRLAKKEERLRAKFARLEATMAELDSMRGAFESMISSLQPVKPKTSSK